jgi:predicted nucleic-acid-binding protein
LVVLAELIWALESLYQFSKNEAESVLEILLQSKDLVVEAADVVRDAMRIFRAGRADFSDCLLERCDHAAGCSHTATFDNHAAAAGMRRLR